jgi:lysophospholipase L1-like esterase
MSAPRTGRLLAATVGLLLAVAPPAARADGLLALGDSFSSGQGAGIFDPGTTGHGNTCFRSALAWPQVLAQRLSLRALPSLACSGARLPEVVTSDARRHEAERRQSQISRITGSPGVITLTIGGNDVGFAQVLGTCVVSGNCVASYRKPSGDVLLRRIRQLEQDLPGAYAAVRARAPHARLVVAGYPRLFPKSGDVDAGGNCAAGRRISDDEATYLNARTAALDAAIRRAAARAGVTYVDVRAAFAGHELRCSGISYVNRLVLRPGIPPYRPGSFHPTAAGHARLAEVVAARLAAVEARAR